MVPISWLRGLGPLHLTWSKELQHGGNEEIVLVSVFTSQMSKQGQGSSSEVNKITNGLVLGLE